METIELREWEMAEVEAFEELGDAKWGLVEWPPSADVRWMRHAFEMPPNDECVAWWLSLQPAVRCQVWVNGQNLGEVSELVEITLSVSIGKNTVVLRLDEGRPQVVTCVPYPCQ